MLLLLFAPLEIENDPQTLVVAAPTPRSGDLSVRRGGSPYE